jgi:hypothetical protein
MDSLNMIREYTDPTQSFAMNVLLGHPFIVATPYGISPSEIINIIVESLRRADVANIYVDRNYLLDDPTISIYQGGSGIFITTQVPNYIQYHPSMIPIYIVEWGVRLHDLESFYEWIGERERIIHLFPQFLSPINSPIFYDTLVDTFDQKLEELVQNINTIPCAIYCDVSQLHRCYSKLKQLGININLVEGQNQRAIDIFKRMRIGILLTDDISNLQSLNSNIPIHLLTFESTNGMILVSYPHHHDHIYIYLAEQSPEGEEFSDRNQYDLLIQGIKDSNFIYDLLISISYTLIRDHHNNLIIQ